MPQAVVPAIIGGVTTLGGALIGSGSANRAAREQRNANNQAMAFERERMAEEKRRYDQEWQFQMDQRRLRDQVARQILSQHGINVPGGAAAQQTPGGKTGEFYKQPSLADLSMPPTIGGGGASDMMDSQGGGAPPMAPPTVAPPTTEPTPMPQPSLGTMTGWSDQLWRRQ